MQMIQPGVYETHLETLLASARTEGLPSDGFFRVLTPRKRRELTYKVKARCADFEIELEVYGSGQMKAYIISRSVVVEEGEVEIHEGRTPVSWAESGVQAIVQTRLGHRHLTSPPCPRDVLLAFIEAMGLHTRACCAGGYAQWKSMMQLYVNRIASEQRCRIEAVVDLPLPHDVLIDLRDQGRPREQALVRVNDISEPENPRPIVGYERGFAELDGAMNPEAASLILVLPGYLIRRRHTEIFHAG